MKTDTWNKLLDLLRLALMTPCRTKADADKIDKQIDELRTEIEHGT
jgi:hypothetical protein